MNSLFIRAVRARVGNDGGVAAHPFPPFVYLFIMHKCLSTHLVLASCCFPDISNIFLLYLFNYTSLLFKIRTMLHLVFIIDYSCTAFTLK